MSDEIWREIPDSNGMYEASSLGRIRSLKTGSPRILSTRMMVNGYQVAYVHMAGKWAPKGVHRLVAMAFHGLPPTEKHHACHYDGDKTNNTPENLRWDTAKGNAADQIRHGRHRNQAKTHCVRGHELSAENVHIRRDGSRTCLPCKRIQEHERYHTKVSPFTRRPKINEADIPVMDAMQKAGLTEREIGEHFGISQSYVNNLLRGKRGRKAA